MVGLKTPTGGIQRRANCANARQVRQCATLFCPNPVFHFSRYALAQLARLAHLGNTQQPIPHPPRHFEGVAGHILSLQQLALPLFIIEPGNREPMGFQVWVPGRATALTGSMDPSGSLHKEPIGPKASIRSAKAWLSSWKGWF